LPASGPLRPGRGGCRRQRPRSGPRIGHAAAWNETVIGESDGSRRARSRARWAASGQDCQWCTAVLTGENLEPPVGRRRIARLGPPALQLGPGVQRRPSESDSAGRHTSTPEAAAGPEHNPRLREVGLRRRGPAAWTPHLRLRVALRQPHPTPPRVAFSSPQ
jgi:hypothetical protein